MYTLRDWFFKYIALTSNEPLAFYVSRAEEEYIFDENNKPYLDCISGISVSNIGHSRKEIIEAIKQQADKYLHTMVYGEHIQNPQVLLAKKLIELTNNYYNRVYFVNSGAEAVELAIKLCRRFTQRKQIIACKKAYHGSTTGAMSLMSDDSYKAAYGTFINDVEFIEFNNIADVDRISNKTAGVFIEIIQGEAGYIPINKEFYNAIYEKCKQVGCLLIVDEIQTGIGRTGKFFAYQHFDKYPDIILLAKALGGGLPLGAILTKEEIANVIKEAPSLGHLTTFGGNPLSCAASLAAIKYIEENNLIENVNYKEKLFFENLNINNFIKIRGKGLLLALELQNSDLVKKIIRYCFEKGILLDWFLFNDKAIRIAPPLTIKREQILFVCETIKEGLRLNKIF